MPRILLFLTTLTGLVACDDDPLKDDDDLSEEVPDNEGSGGEGSGGEGSGSGAEGAGSTGTGSGPVQLGVAWLAPCLSGIAVFSHGGVS